MASKRVAKSAVEWAKFEKLVPKPDVGEFQSLKNRSMTYVNRVSGLPEALPSIDWAQYKRRTKAFAGVVEDFEKKYASLTVPYPGAPSDSLNQISKQEQEEVVHQKKYAQGAAEQVKQWEEDLKRWTSLPPVGHMTKGEQVEYFPDLVIDLRKQPSIFPHTEEYNDPAMLARVKNYRIDFPEKH